MELKINPILEKAIPPLSPAKQKALKKSIQKYGQREPIDVMPDGTIIDGHHRYKIVKELGLEPKYKVNEDITTIKQALELGESLNTDRRHYNTAMAIWHAYNVEKAELEAEAKEVMLSKLKRGKEAPSGSAEPSGRTADRIAERLGVSAATVKRGFQIIRDAPEEIKELWLDEKVLTNSAATAVEALESIPEEYKDRKQALIDMVVKEPERITEIKKIVGETNAVIAMLDGEPDKVREEAEKLLKPLYFTPDLNIKEALWQVEEIAKTGHVITKGRKWADEIGETWEEAQAWFAHYGGYCIGEVKGWEGEWDHQREQLEKKEQKE